MEHLKSKRVRNLSPHCMCHPYRVNTSLDLIPYAIQILEILKSQSVSVNSLPCYSNTSESFLILLSQFNFNPFSPSSIMILHKNILLRHPAAYLFGLELGFVFGFWLGFGFGFRSWLDHELGSRNVESLLVNSEPISFRLDWLSQT